MPNILTSNLRHKNVQNFLDTITNESVYFGFSNPIDWTDPTIPDSPIDNYNITSDCFSDMLYAKRLTSSNASRVIRNNAWVSGSRYQQYSATEDINNLIRTKTYSTATATAIISGSGVVSGFSITNPGTEYTSVPSVTISGSATATAIISSGSVIGFTLTSPGSGYTTAPTVTIAAPSAITTTPFDLKPFYVITDDLNVFKCISNNGGGESKVKPTIPSPVTALTPTPIDPEDNYQWKYLYTVSSADAEKFYNSNWIPVKTLSSDDGSTQWTIQAAAESGSSPYHGANAVKELHATNLMVKVRVSGNEGGEIVDTNDYRQISLVLNPVATGSVYSPTGTSTSTTLNLNATHVTAFGSDTSLLYYPNAGTKIIIISGPGKGQIREIASYATSVVTLKSGTTWDVIPTTASTYGFIAKATSLNQTTILTMTSPSGSFALDGTINQSSSGASGKIAKYDSTTNKIYLTSVSGTFNTSAISGAGTATSVAVTNPRMVTLSGDVMYLENRKAITRYPDQIEDVKVIIQY